VYRADIVNSNGDDNTDITLDIFGSSFCIYAQVCFNATSNNIYIYNVLLCIVMLCYVMLCYVMYCYVMI
jgi:hypothetical protein